jgi:hypothetical protein
LGKYLILVSVTLSCGNYLNGGNKQRGQADGFTLDILPKIKDVKTKDNQSNLLAYIVKFCTERYDEKKGTPEAVLPVPEPSDVEKCSTIDFETQAVEVDRLETDLKAVQRITERVLDKSSEERKEPFGTKVMRGHSVDVFFLPMSRIQTLLIWILFRLFALIRTRIRLFDTDPDPTI